MENKLDAKSSIEVAADLKYSGAVRNFISGFLLAEEVPELWTKRLILVADELFMNAVRYGSSEGSFVKIKCFADEEKVSITIMDDGTGKGKISAAELQALVQKKGEEMDHRKTSGRGLSVIASEWADSCEADDLPEGGIAIEIIKYRKNLTQVQKPKVLEKENVQTEVEENEEEEIDKKDLSIHVVSFSGSIDNSNLQDTIEPVRNLINDEKPYYLILDFSELNYFNSLFIGTLADWNTRIEKKGGRLAIVGANDSAREILELCGLINIIPIYNSLEEAKQ